MRKFESGATRDVDTSKLDFEGFIHPSVIERYAEYMHENRIQADGSVRSSDNWQKGIPKDVYMKSAFRHFFDVWKEHRGMKTSDGIEKAICALMFNIQGYLFEHLKEKQVAQSQEDLNKRVDDYLTGPRIEDNTFEDGTTFGIVFGRDPSYEAYKAHERAFQAFVEKENGDYDSRHNASIPSPAVLVSSEILGLHSQRPPSEVDPLAPESCVSRCY